MADNAFVPSPALVAFKNDGGIIHLIYREASGIDKLAEDLELDYHADNDLRTEFMGQKIRLDLTKSDDVIVLTNVATGVEYELVRGNPKNGRPNKSFFAYLNGVVRKEPSAVDFIAACKAKKKVAAPPKTTTKDDDLPF